MYIRSYKFWIFIIYLILIISLSSQSGNKLVLFPNLWKIDKIVHFIEYFILGILLINVIKIKPLSRKKWLGALIFLLLFPIFDESLQFFIPRRIPDIYDAIADIAGGFIGAYIRKYI